jgi:hypothetical protein
VVSRWSACCSSPRPRLGLRRRGSRDDALGSRYSWLTLHWRVEIGLQREQLRALAHDAHVPERLIERTFGQEKLGLNRASTTMLAVC